MLCRTGGAARGIARLPLTWAWAWYTRERRSRFLTRSVSTIRHSGWYPANSPSYGIALPRDLRPEVDREPIHLDGHDVGIRQGLEADEPAVLGAQDAALEIGEVVELAQLLRLVGVVEVADEPVRGVAQDVALDRADL